MFAHQVIEESRNGRTPDKSIIYHEVMSFMESVICFHFGKFDSILSVYNNFVGVPIFNDSLGESAKLPYKCCWFDIFERKWKHGFLLIDGELFCNRLKESWIKEDIMAMGKGFACFYFGCAGNQGWGMVPIGHYVTPNVLREPYPKNNKVDYKVTYSALPVHLDYPKESTPDVGKFSIEELSMVNVMLLLLNCKNIATKIVPAPDKLNKKRIKQGKQPLFSYHTLVIKPGGKRQESIPRHLWENRIHLQRGHFKTYTIEKPLFGHITGRFWWQPHVRGRNKDGVVMKDYEVKTH